jgi:inhibitor of cysteine peptidase
MQAGSKVGGMNKGTVVFFVTLLVVSAVFAAYSVLPAHKAQPVGSSAGATAQGLSSFQTYSQLQAFVAANAKSAQQYDRYGGAGFIGGPMMFDRGVNGGLVAGIAVPGAAVQNAAAVGSSSGQSFTGTNVQVQGVDEPDLVKTDGAHLFVATNGTSSSSSSGSVTIMDAYPPNSAAVLATVSLPGAQVLGIEVAQDRLMVIDQRYTNTTYIGLLLYNTSTLASPKLMENETVAGNYVAARLAQGYLYAVVQQPSYHFDGQGNATGVMPFVSANGDRTALSASSVYYTPNNSQIGDYTMIISLGMSSGEQHTLSVLTGPSSTVFVSTSSIYVVYSNYREYANADNIPGDVFSGGVITTVGQEQNSTIFRASYSNGTVAVQAVGSVPGRVLNQFSMNEYEAYFQVATSRIATINGNATMSDDVYVLNQNMSQVSALQNIAPGENLYAVRFVGDMGYVVTFEQIDPLFVSALKVNGYSDYLQPLFTNYLLGVGKDTVASSTGNFAYYLGLKLSLFHVAANGSSSDVQDYKIGDRGTDSPVLTNHLALTYDPANNVTVIPILLAKLSGNQQGSSENPPPEGNPVWQGAYVFKVNATGFALLGTVSQYPAGMNYGDSPDNGLQIERSVIIGNYLYTISQSEVMVSSLSSFSTVATVPLPGS